MGVSDWAKYGEDGQEVSNPVFPYRLRFQVLSNNLDQPRHQHQHQSQPQPQPQPQFQSQPQKNLTSLCSQPTGQISFPDEYVRPFTEDLMSIPRDSILYDILALDQPEEMGGVEAHIGQLVLRSSQSNNVFGILQRFFNPIKFERHSSKFLQSETPGPK